MIDLSELPEMDQAQITAGHALQLVSVLESHMHTHHHGGVDLAAHALLASIESQLKLTIQALMEMELASESDLPDADADAMAEEAYRASGIKP